MRRGGDSYKGCQDDLIHSSGLIVLLAVTATLGEWCTVTAGYHFRHCTDISSCIQFTTVTLRVPSVYHYVESKHCDTEVQ